MRVKAPDHHRADRWGNALEHVLVAERKYGIKITTDYTIHHKNGVRNDNRPENLELWTGQHPFGARVEDVIEFMVDRHSDAVLAAIQRKEPEGQSLDSLDDCRVELQL